MAENLRPLMAAAADCIRTVRESPTGDFDHGYRLACGLGRAPPLAIPGRPAIFRRRHSPARLVRAGGPRAGRRRAMARAPGARVWARARTGDGGGAGAAAVHQRGRSTAGSLLVPGPG